MRSTFAAQGFKKARDWLDHIHVARDRLNNDAGNLFAVRGEGGFDASDIVVIQHDGMGDKFGWHAGRSRIAARGEQARARLDQEAVCMAVITAFKLNDLVAAGGATRQTNRRHGGFGA